MGNPSKNPLLDHTPLDDFEADDPLASLTQTSIDRPPSPPPVWQDEIAGMFWDSGWDLRPHFKNQAWKSSIDMFVFDDKHWLNVYCKSLEFRLTRVNLRKLRSISKRHRCNHSILIYNGTIKPDQYNFAKELNILIINQKDIGTIRNALTGFVRDYPDSHINNSSTFDLDPALIEIVKELLPSFPKRWVPIAREAQRKRERLSSIPFHAETAEREGNNYWIRLSISHRGED